MEGALEAVPTVNSVAARWTVTLQPSERAPRSLRARAALEQLGAGSGASEDIQEMDVQPVSSDSPCSLTGAYEFHFLLPRTRYRLKVELLLCPSGEPLELLREVETTSVGQGLPSYYARAFPQEMWRCYVGREHTLGEWLGRAPQDFVWALQPEFQLLRSLWLSACFTLPSPGSPITQCPNPRSRYCLDLTKAGRWLHSKKVRRHKDDFKLSVNANYTDTFMRCAKLHKDRGHGTWITADLVQALDRCRCEGGDLKVYSIELWEKNTGELAAAIVALSLGDIFHDYTMATMIRDRRSPGAIISKVLGHLLAECGYTLWYWGFKNDYMAEYDDGYCGVLLDNEKEFWPRWKAAQQQEVPCDLATRIKPGLENALDLACL